ncbi:MAG: hypothetical protein K8R23_06930 [Chthoniobacter sp.]|nr:hypothetical protein [Chthoniobacter sp.]
MLPLAAEKFPATPDELATALAAGLSVRGVQAKGVHAAGAGLAEIAELQVDLTGARCTRDFRVSTAPVTESAAVEIAHFVVMGEPMDFEGTPLRLNLEAEGVSCGFAGAPRDGTLVLTSATGGSLVLAVAHEALEALLHRLAKGVAEKQGVEIRQTKLTLTARGPRVLSFRCTVTAKVFVMTAELSLSGDLEVDEQLQARLSGLTLGGDAMITKMAAGFARPYLDKLEGRTIPLLAFGLGGMRLRDVELATADGLEIRAKFGRG